MLKIGITGNNGFIGKHLLNRIYLSKDKYRVIDFKRVYFDDPQLLDDFVSSCDVIVHLAAVNRHSDEHYLFNKNIQLAEALIDSFYRTDFRGQLIFSSSIQEERNNKFGNSKKNARELFSKWSNLTGGYFVGLIIPNVFGPFGIPFYNSVVSTFCHQLIENKTPKVEVDAYLNLIYIDDLIKKIILFFGTKSNHAYSILHTNTCKVSTILFFLEKFHFKYYKNGLIPKLENIFELNLFNTFRSYIDIRNHFPIKYKNNVDERGNFVEIIRLESGGQVSFSTTLKGVTRGNHFHTRKVERFSVIKGQAIIQLRKIDTEEVISFKLSGEEPAYVDMPIWYTHNITNIGNDDLYTMFWINEFFDENDPDTYFENV